jgi:hypothetical protein
LATVAACAIVSYAAVGVPCVTASTALAACAKRITAESAVAANTAVGRAAVAAVAAITNGTSTGYSAVAAIATATVSANAITSTVSTFRRT